MKILFLTKVKAYAGSEKYLVNLLPELTLKGIICKLVVVVEQKHDGNLSHFYLELERLNINYEKIIINNTLSFYLLNELNAILKSDKWDVLHAHLIHSELWGSLLTLLFRKKIKIASTIHSFDETYQAKFGYSIKNLRFNFYYWICRFNSIFVDKYFAVSDALTNLYIDGGICKSNKIETIHHGIKLEDSLTKNDNQVLNDKNEILIDSLKKCNHKIILIPGRIVKYKGQIHLINAIPEVINAYPNCKFIFIGERQGTYALELIDRIKNLGVHDSCFFFGHVSNPQLYLKNADIVILPSVVEGFGLIALEVMQYSKPIIAFDVPALNEIIVEGKTGYLVRPFNIKELSNKILNCLTDENLCKEMGIEGQTHAINKFSFEKMLLKTECFYFSLSVDK